MTRERWEIEDAEGCYRLWVELKRRELVQCKNCKYFEPYKFGGYDGKCHRFPQQPFLSNEDWCGEFKRKPSTETQQKDESK